MLLLDIPLLRNNTRLSLPDLINHKELLRGIVLMRGLRSVSFPQFDLKLADSLLQNRHRSPAAVKATLSQSRSGEVGWVMQTIMHIVRTTSSALHDAARQMFAADAATATAFATRPKLRPQVFSYSRDVGS